MLSKILVVCDREEEYASAFAHYLMKKEELAFQVQTCSDFSHVLKIQEETGIDYLFVSSEVPPESRKRIKTGNVFVLTENKGAEILDRETAVYKYQPGDGVLAELVRQCGEGETAGDTFLRTVGRKQMRIIGVYSPVHRIGKTSYALELGRRLSVETDVLYLNLETYGGIGGHFEEGGQTLSDVLYYVRQEKGNLGLFLTTVVKHKGKLDYVAPVQVSEDIKNVSSEEWLHLIREIAEQSIYEVVILDMDEGLRDLYPVLDSCTEIHMLTAADPVSVSKVRQFEEELALLGYDGIRRKITRKERKV